QINHRAEGFIGLWCPSKGLVRNLGCLRQVANRCYDLAVIADEAPIEPNKAEEGTAVLYRFGRGPIANSSDLFRINLQSLIAHYEAQKTNTGAAELTFTPLGVEFVFPQRTKHGSN